MTREIPFAEWLLSRRRSQISLLLIWMFAADQLAAIEPTGSRALHRIVPQTSGDLQKVFQPSTSPLRFVSAHRGGPQPGFPENCLATFEKTLRHTFAIMELDPRYTKDGAIVVNHDPTLERTTTGKGRVADLTLVELKRLRLKDNTGQITEFQIPTLDEVLDWAQGKTVVVLDQKDVPATERVKMIGQHHAENCALVIVMNFKDAQACHTLNPNVMMEVMIPNLEKAKEFDQTGVPWKNVVAFVGHTPPDDAALYEFIHRKGASCMIGTSRNLDRAVITGQVGNIEDLEPDYMAFLRRGADIIETDIPAKLGPMLQGRSAAASTPSPYLREK